MLYALQDWVEAVLDQLEKVGVIEPVVHSEWAMSMVTVLMKNGEICLCGDFKATIDNNLCVGVKRTTLMQ